MNYIAKLKEEILLPVSFTAVYVVISIFYLIRLDVLNRDLKGLSNAIDVMSFENGIAWNYLLFAIILILAGLGIIYTIWISRSATYNSNLITLFVLFVLIGLTMGLIIFYINNPILRAALSLIVLLGVISISASS